MVAAGFLEWRVHTHDLADREAAHILLRCSLTLCPTPFDPAMPSCSSQIGYIRSRRGDNSEAGSAGLQEITTHSRRP